MASTAVARRYARAYFDLARAAGDIAGWRRQLSTVVERLTNSEVAAALVNPRVSGADRLRIVASVLEGVQSEARNLARLLVERRRIALLPRVAEEYDVIADRESGVVRATVTTAVPVDRALEQQIAAVLSARFGGDVQVSSAHEPEILGGLVLRVGDRVIDASVRTRLERLRTALA